MLRQVFKKSKLGSYFTFGDVADASKGNNPPQAIIKLSDNCEIKCTVLTTNIAFSVPLTKSKTDFVECLYLKKLIRFQFLLLISLNL